MSRQEERERLRQERLAAQTAAGSSERRRLMVGYGVAGLLTLAVLGGLVAVIAGGNGSSEEDAGCTAAHIQSAAGSFNGLQPDCREGTPPPELQQGDLALAAKAASCELQTDLPDEGATHVPNSEEVTYKTNPPTSGNHNPNPIADGAYLTPVATNIKAAAGKLNQRNFVHSMEHGRVEIQYSSDLPDDQQLMLKGVFDEDPAGMLMFPNDDMPYAIAVTAWRQLLTCKTYNEQVVDAIRVFRDVYRGQGPEPIPTSL